MDKKPIGEPIFMDGEHIGVVNVGNSWDDVDFAELAKRPDARKVKFRTVSWPSDVRVLLDVLDRMEANREQED